MTQKSVLLLLFALPLLASQAHAVTPRIRPSAKAPAASPAKPTEFAISATDHVLGSATAPVTLIEYGSVACPACATFNETVFPQLKAKYIDTGKVRYVFRPMLTGVPVIAVAGTRMAECVGNEKYFAVIDAVMRAQHEYYAWGESNIIAQPVLVRIAQSFGLSEAAYNTCATDTAALARLQEGHKAALNLGVASTPTLFVNGKAVARTDLDSLDAAIASALPTASK